MTDYFTVKRNPELIERAVLDKIRDEIEEHTDGNNHCDEYLDGYNEGMKDALEIIDKYVEERQTASWEKFGKNAYACTNCRRGVYSRENYCPECGSLMKKE